MSLKKTHLELNTVCLSGNQNVCDPQILWSFRIFQAEVNRYSIYLLCCLFRVCVCVCVYARVCACVHCAESRLFGCPFFGPHVSLHLCEHSF